MAGKPRPIGQARRYSRTPMPAESSTPKVAIVPDPAPGWVEAAIADGGGLVVPLADAEALVWTSPGRADELVSLVATGKRLRWVQLPWAGVDAFVAAGVFDRCRRDLQWACAKGLYGEQVAEHALALILAGLRHLRERARATSWGREAADSLFERTVTVLGGGGITRSLLSLLAPFRCEVTVVRRSPGEVPGAARTVTVDRLEEVLGADVVVVAMPLTPDTRGIIGERQLAAMSERAWLVNVGRGEHVVTDALVAALEKGRIAGGAGCDRSRAVARWPPALGAAQRVDHAAHGQHVRAGPTDPDVPHPGERGALSAGVAAEGSG